MLPTNISKGQGCNPVSSNCVIWQGPDIPCVNLCHGDSVTDVVFKLATELCKILDELKISTYDLSCFQPVCPTPESFHDLIQCLINRICKIEDCVYEPCAPGCECLKCKEPQPQTNCPEKCIVNIAPCFQFTNQLGDTVTTMPLTDYVTAIGNLICQLIGQIGNATTRLDNNENLITNIGNRLTNLEENPVTVTIPSSCLLGPGPEGGWPVSTVVQNLENEFCNLKTATGSPVEILQSIQKQCVNLDGLKTLTNRSATYASIPGWITQENYNNLADSINNMWLAICDMRAAVENILLTCCCTDCDDVDISFTATLSGTSLSIHLTGSVPTGMTDCFPQGNLVTITDINGGSYTTYIQVISNLNNTVTIGLANTPVNVSTNLTITIHGCWKRPAAGGECGGLECSRIMTYNLINTAPCPNLTVTPGVTSIAYMFTNTVSGPVTYTVKLFTCGGVFVGQFVHANPGLVVLSNTFTGLSSGSCYYIVVEAVINGNKVTCPQAFVNTTCSAPLAVSAEPVIVA